MPGYRVSSSIFLDPIAQLEWEQYRCPCCGLLVRDAVQPSCGHRMCETCVQGLFQAATGGSGPQCPREDCRQELTEYEGFKYFPDRAVRREIRSYNVRCLNHDRRCRWQGKMAEYEDHVTKKCMFAKHACQFCGKIEDSHEATCPEAGQQCPISEEHECQDKTLIPNTAEEKQSLSFVDLPNISLRSEPKPPMWNAVSTAAFSQCGTWVVFAKADRAIVLAEAIAEAIRGIDAGAIAIMVEAMVGAGGGAVSRAGGRAWGGTVGRAGGGAVVRAWSGAVSRAGGRAWGGLQFDQQQTKEEWAESHPVKLPLHQVLEEVNGLLKSELAKSKKNIVALQMAVSDLEEQLQTKTAELERMDGQILAALMG